MTIRQKLLDVGKRITELETVLEALTDKEKALRTNGDDTRADELAYQIKGYQAQLDEQHRIFVELLEQSNAEAVARNQTEKYWDGEFSSRLLDLLNSFVFWMRNNHLANEDRSLWDMFGQDDSDCETA